MNVISRTFNTKYTYEMPFWRYDLQTKFEQRNMLLTWIYKVASKIISKLPLNPFFPFVSMGLFLAISLIISWTIYLSCKPTSLGLNSTWFVLANVVNSRSMVLLPAWNKIKRRVRKQKFRKGTDSINNGLWILNEIMSSTVAYKVKKRYM